MENKNIVIETNSPEETFKLGFDMGKKAKEGEVYCLNGDLGVGKTIFTKGFAKGLGIDENITSPTYTLVNEYNGEFKFYHFDVYRINDAEEMEEIGFDEYIYSDAIVLIEWSDKIKELLPENIIKIHIKKDLKKGLEFRKIILNKKA